MTLPDFIPAYRKLYLTPDDIPVGRFCRTLRVPDDPIWVGLVDGALSALAEPEAWREYGDLLPEETAQAWLEMLIDSWSIQGCVSEVPTPYWDEATDLDDEAPAEEQSWYGIFDGTFQETIENFVIAGFIAYSGSVEGAIFFLTIAPRFRLAWKTGDLGGIVRVFVDAADQGTVNTYSATEGVIEMDYIGDPDLEEHEILMVLEEIP